MEIIALVLILVIAVSLQGSLFFRLALRRLDYKCEFSVKEAFEGDNIFLVETVHNKKFLPIPWLKVDINSSRWLEFAGTKSVVAQEHRYVTSNFLLKSYQKTTRRWKLKCLKRGVYSTDKVTLVTGDLLGMNTNSTPVNVNANLIVYPAMIDIKNLFIPANSLQGDNVVKRWVVDDPFMISGTREYSSWDPMNKIHWGATARAGKLMVRNNDFTAQHGMTVIMNIQSIDNEYHGTVDREKVELGIRLAATLFDMAVKSGTPARLASNASTIDNPQQMIFTSEAAGQEHIRDLLKVLAKIKLGRVKDFEDFLSEIDESVKNTDVILISSYINERIVNFLEGLRKRNSVTVFVLEPLEAKKVPGSINTYMFGGDDENAG